MLGEPGQGFIVAQTRLGGGRIHHAMRTVAKVKRAFDMTCERALSRTTQGEVLAQKQLVQAMIADSWIDIEQFRLLVLRTAWKIDRYKDYRKVRADISAVKAAMPRVYHDVYSRALQIHGSLGLSTEMPFAAGVLDSYHMGLADGPTEVHKVTVARQVLGGYQGTNELFPDYHLIKRRDAALAKYADVLEATKSPNSRDLEPYSTANQSIGGFAVRDEIAGSLSKNAGNRRTRGAPTAATDAATTARSAGARSTIAPFFCAYAAPQHEHETFALLVQNFDDSIRERLPAAPLMRAGATTFDRQHRIQQQHALPCPRRQTTVARVRDVPFASPARDARVAMSSLISWKMLQQRRRLGDAGLHGKTQAVRLVRTVIRILTDDDHANVFDRRQIERGEDLGTARIDRLVGARVP